MPKKEKEKKVEEMAKLFSQSTSIIFANYRGMPTSEMTQLRHKLREQGIQLHVVKNTLAGLAGKSMGKSGWEDFLVGPTAIACGSGEVAEPAKLLMEYVTASKTALKIKGGAVGERPLKAEEVAALAKLPPRNVLVARLLGELKAPLFSLHFVLSANMRKLLMILQARARQMEGEKT